MKILLILLGFVYVHSDYVTEISTQRYSESQTEIILQTKENNTIRCHEVFIEPFMESKRVLTFLQIAALSFLNKSTVIYTSENCNLDILFDS